MTFFLSISSDLLGCQEEYLIMPFSSLIGIWSQAVAHFCLGSVNYYFLFIIIKCIRGGQRATERVWDGARGLEWTIPSPAPYHTFSTPPKDMAEAHG